MSDQETTLIDWDYWTLKPDKYSIRKVFKFCNFICFSE